jgi:hypothetical protein
MTDDPRRYIMTPEQLRAWEEFHKAMPGWKVRWDLEAQYARDQGGLVLRFWTLHHGPAFGEPTLWSLEACAEELEVEVSQLREIYAEMTRWVEPRVEADPEWQRLYAMDELELWEEAQRRTGGKLGPAPEAIRARAGRPRFMYRHFSDEASSVVFGASQIAAREQATEVRPAHLRAAITTGADPSADPDAESVSLFSPEMAAVVTRAHDDAQAEGRLVTLDDLRDALTLSPEDNKRPGPARHRRHTG